MCRRALAVKDNAIGPDHASALNSGPLFLASRPVCPVVLSREVVRVLITPIYHAHAHLPGMNSLNVFTPKVYILRNLMPYGFRLNQGHPPQKSISLSVVRIRRAGRKIS
jgi:hypothetical protein